MKMTAATHEISSAITVTWKIERVYSPVVDAAVVVRDPIATRATARKAGELGGQVLVPPTDIPNVGRFSVLADPQGVMFSVITYLPM